MSRIASQYDTCNCCGREIGSGGRRCVIRLICYECKEAGHEDLNCPICWAEINKQIAEDLENLKIKMEKYGDSKTR